MEVEHDHLVPPIVPSVTIGYFLNLLVALIFFDMSV